MSLNPATQAAVFIGEMTPKEKGQVQTIVSAALTLAELLGVHPQVVLNAGMLLCTLAMSEVLPAEREEMHDLLHQATRLPVDAFERHVAKQELKRQNGVCDA